MGRVVRYLPAIRRMAQKIYDSHPPHGWMSVEDLVSVGIVAALRVSRRYDAQRGVGFYLFMAPRVHGAMIEYYRRKRLVDLQSCQPCGTVNDLERSNPSFRGDFRDDVAERYKEVLYRKVAVAVRRMRGPSRDVLHLVYYERKSLAQAARELGIPVKEAQQRLKRGLELLRRKIQGVGVHEYAADMI